MIPLAWLIPVLPALGYGIITFLTRPSRRLSAAVSIGAMGASFVLSLGIVRDLFTLAPEARRVVSTVPWLEVKPLLAEAGTLVDPLAAIMLLVVTTVSLLVQVYSLGYMHDDTRFSAFFSYLSLFSASMLGLVLSPNYLQIYLCWELVGLSSYLLIGFWYQKPSAAAACKKAFVVTRFGDLGFLIAVVLIGTRFSTFDFGRVHDAVAAGLADGTVTTGFVLLLGLLLFCGAAGKSGQFPLHIWLPDAMEGPTPVSALIHAATMVAAGVFLVARAYPVFSGDPAALAVVAWVGGFTALFAALIALTQNDIKRVLAYSTLSQLGYMMLALGAGGYAAGMFHLFTHAFFKALLFLAAGSVIHAVHTNDIRSMGGLLKPLRITGFTFLIAALAISGVPPLAGFWSKDEILAAVHASSVPGHQVLFTMALFTAFLTAFYMFRLFFNVFTGASRAQDHGHPHESPAVMTVPLVILAVLSCGAGLVNAPGLHLFSSFLHPEGGVEEIHLGLASLSTLVGLAGIGLSVLFYATRTFSAENTARALGPLYRLSYHKFYIDEIYEWLVRNILFRLASAFAWFDKRVVDGGMVDGAGWLTRQAGHLIRLSQTGRVQQYAWVLFAAVVIVFLALGLQAGVAP